MTGPAFVAGAALISALVAPTTEVPPMTYEHSADVSNTFLANLIADCSPSGLNCRPIHLVACWLHESGLSARAQNASGGAAGFFQAMPFILRDLGFKGDARYREPAGAYAAAHDDATRHALNKALSDAFCRLTLEQQLEWAFRYYRPHAGQLPNPGACYAANFVPGLLAHAGEPGFIICAADGRASWRMNPDPAKAAAQSRQWFAVNKSLDADGDGAITMGDLVTTASRSLATPRGQELAARLDALAGGDEPAPDTQPEGPVAGAGGADEGQAGG